VVWGINRLTLIITLTFIWSLSIKDFYSQAKSPFQLANEEQPYPLGTTDQPAQRAASHRLTNYCTQIHIFFLEMASFLYKYHPAGGKSILK